MTYDKFKQRFFYAKDCTKEEDLTIYEELKKESDRANDLEIEQAQNSVVMKVKKKVIAQNLKSQCNGKCVLGVKRLAIINSQAADLKKLRSDAKSASNVTNVSTAEVIKLKGTVVKLTTQLADATAKIKVITTGAVTKKKYDDLLIKFTTLQTTHTATVESFRDEIKRHTQPSIPFNSVVPSPRYIQDMSQNMFDFAPVQQTSMMNMNMGAMHQMQQLRNLQQQQQQQMAALLVGNRGIQQGAFSLF